MVSFTRDWLLGSLQSSLRVTTGISGTGCVLPHEIGISIGAMGLSGFLSRSGP